LTTTILAHRCRQGAIHPISWAASFFSLDRFLGHRAFTINRRVAPVSRPAQRTKDLFKSNFFKNDFGPFFDSLLNWSGSFAFEFRHPGWSSSYRLACSAC
jgi:hypothetical protein